MVPSLQKKNVTGFVPCPIGVPFSSRLRKLPRFMLTRVPIPMTSSDATLEDFAENDAPPLLLKLPRQSRQLSTTWHPFVGKSKCTKGRNNSRACITQPRYPDKSTYMKARNNYDRKRKRCHRPRPRPCSPATMGTTLMTATMQHPPGLFLHLHLPPAPATARCTLTTGFTHMVVLVRPQSLLSCMLFQLKTQRHRSCKITLLGSSTFLIEYYYHDF